MRNRIALIICICGLIVTACGNKADQQDPTTAETVESVEESAQESVIIENIDSPATAVAAESGLYFVEYDLDGTWEQDDKSGDAWQEAVILDDYLEVYWVTDGGETKSLYWAGSIIVPTSPVEVYKWTSENDRSKTDTAILASGSDTKEFTFDNNRISYTVSAMGQSKTVHLERISDSTVFVFGGPSQGGSLEGALTPTADNSDIYFKEMPGDRDTIINNIKIEEEHTDKAMAVMMTNNNPFVIPDLDLTVVFYKNGSMIDSDTDGHDVMLPGSTVVSDIDVPKDADDFKITVDVDWKYATSYKNWAENVSFESNIGENNVMIQFTNNGDVDIDELEYIVLFYKDGEFVDVSSCNDVHDFRAGSTIVEKESAHHKITFDDYKIFINQAHTFGL